MREFSQAGKIVNGDRLAVITALNVSHELLLQKKQVNTYMDTMSHRIRDLHAKIEDNLAIED